MDPVAEMVKLALKLGSQHVTHGENGEMNEYGNSMADEIKRLHDLAIRIDREGAEKHAA